MKSAPVQRGGGEHPRLSCGGELLVQSLCHLLTNHVSPPGRSAEPSFSVLSEPRE